VRGAAFAADRPFGAASKRSSDGFALAFDFNGLGIVLQVMRGMARRIALNDYAMDGL
jgi:hypothetical protein